VVAWIFSADYFRLLPLPPYDWTFIYLYAAVFFQIFVGPALGCVGACRLNQRFLWAYWGSMGKPKHIAGPQVSAPERMKNQNKIESINPVVHIVGHTALASSRGTFTFSYQNFCRKQKLRPNLSLGTSKEHH
jgi:hypothetical protein